MIIILTDAYLAEGASGINVKQLQEKNLILHVFNPLKIIISKTTIHSSLAYYSKHLKIKKLYSDKVWIDWSVLQANGKLD